MLSMDVPLFVSAARSGGWQPGHRWRCPGSVACTGRILLAIEALKCFHCYLATGKLGAESSAFSVITATAWPERSCQVNCIAPLDSTGTRQLHSSTRGRRVGATST
jgi:hypothetical protein